MLWFRITLHRSNALNLLYTGFTLCFTLWLFKKTPTILSTNQSKFNSFLRLSVVKPKPRYAQQSIRTRETPLGAHDNSKQKQANCLRCEKLRVKRSWLLLVLHLIGQEGGASFLDQSQIAKMQKNPVLDNFPHLVVNLLLKQKVNEWVNFLRLRCTLSSSFSALILLLLYFLSCLFHDCPSRGFGSRHSKNALWDAVTLLHSVFRLVWSEIIVRFYSFSVGMGRYYWWNVRPHGQSTLPY